MHVCHRVAVIAMVVAAASGASAVRADEFFVTMTSSRFVPANLTVKVGDTVIWENTAALVHTVTSGTPCTPNGLFNSGDLEPGAQFGQTFLLAGTYPYFCIYHCLIQMRGNITAELIVPTTNTTWGRIKALYAVGTR